MNKTTILIAIATLALAGCNRGGFKEYHPKPDAKARALESKRVEMRKHVTGAAMDKYYAVAMKVGKDQKDVVAKAPPQATIMATNVPNRPKLPSASGYILRPRPPGKAPEYGRIPPNPNAAEDKAAMDRMYAERAKAMRAEAKRAEMRHAVEQAARKDKTKATAGKGRADVTLPAQAR